MTTSPSDLPLLFVPGLACTAALFTEQLQVLGKTHEVFVADHTRHDSIGTIVRSILAKAPERFGLIGLSMGGVLAFEIMRQAPHRVERLAILDASARADSAEKTAGRRAAVKMVEEGQYDQVCQTTAETIIAKSRQNDDVLIGEIFDMAKDMGAEAWLRQMTALLARVSSLPLLQYIDCPTLVVIGDDDQLTPRDCADEIVEGIPGAKLEVIADCGHMSTMERPDDVTRCLQEWLRY